MDKATIEKYENALKDGQQSPSAIATIQIELAAQAAYISEKLTQLRNKKPEFFMQKKKEIVPETGKQPSNELIEMVWQQACRGQELALRNDLETLDRFLTAAKSCLIALTVESRVQE